MTEDQPMPVDTWLERLAAASGSSRDLSLGADERHALLDLARVAAHTSERIAAPLSTFLAGIVAAEMSTDERSRFIARLTKELSSQE